MNRADTEIAGYLERLLEHERHCGSDNCPTCSTLQSVVDLVRDKLFASRVYLTGSTPESPDQASARFSTGL